MGSHPVRSLSRTVPVVGIALILASASPRRDQLLRSIGLDFEVRPADIDEAERSGEHPIAYVERVAGAKALAIGDRILGHGDDVCVLAADTTVDLDGTILAKPVDDDDARRMLRMLSGRTHLVHTAVVGRRSRRFEAVTVTTV